MRAGGEGTALPLDSSEIVKDTKPVAKIISLSQLQKSRKQAPEYVYEVEPVEIGLTAEDCGTSPGEKVGLQFRPITATELGDILVKIKDLEAPYYGTARDEMIIQTCLTNPRLPAGAEGNMVMMHWLPGTKLNLSAGIQAKSGYTEHVVKDALAEVKK